MVATVKSEPMIAICCMCLQRSTALTVRHITRWHLEVSGKILHKEVFHSLLLESNNSNIFGGHSFHTVGSVTGRTHGLGKAVPSGSSLEDVQNIWPDLD